jgi:chromosome segregation ATPase
VLQIESDVSTFDFRLDSLENSEGENTGDSSSNTPIQELQDIEDTIEALTDRMLVLEENTGGGEDGNAIGQLELGFEDLSTRLGVLENSDEDDGDSIQQLEDAIEGLNGRLDSLDNTSEEYSNSIEQLGLEIVDLSGRLGALEIVEGGAEGNVLEPLESEIEDLSSRVASLESSADEFTSYINANNSTDQQLDDLYSGNNTDDYWSNFFSVDSNGDDDTLIITAPSVSIRTPQEKTITQMIEGQNNWIWSSDTIDCHAGDVVKWYVRASFASGR